MILKKEAGAYHKTKNRATILKKIFQKQRKLAAIYLYILFFLRFKLGTVIIARLEGMPVEGSMRKSFLN